MWTYLEMNEPVRMVILAVVLLPMIVIGALLRKKNAKRPYHNKLGMMAHYYAIAMAVAMVLGDFYIGTFEFSMLTYVLGVSFALLLWLTYGIYFLIVAKKYKNQLIELK